MANRTPQFSQPSMQEVLISYNQNLFELLHLLVEDEEVLMKTDGGLTTEMQNKWERLKTTIEKQRKFWKNGRENLEALNPFTHAPCMEELLKIGKINHESEFYWAAIEYLASDENGRQVFMTLPKEAAKIKFLERKTGIVLESI